MAELINLDQSDYTDDDDFETLPDGSVILEGEEEDPEANPHTDDHYINLAEILPDEFLNNLGSEVLEGWQADKDSRQEWESIYRDGLKAIEPSTPEHQDQRTSRNLARVKHPMMIEAATQFQGRAIGELYPPEGPVKARIMGKNTPEREEQKDRVATFMNYQVQEEMPEYFPELDQMLFHLPLAGQAFKKVYYDEALGRNTCIFVPAEDFYVSYTTTSLQTSSRYTHLFRRTKSNLLRDIANEQYIKFDIEASTADDEEEPVSKEVEGRDPSERDEDGELTLLEQHVDLDIPGLEHDFPLPYIVTIEKSTQKVLAVRRNWRPDDPLFKKRMYFVSYKFLPGLGFYGFGLYHAIGGLSDAATGALRSLLDSAAFSNLQGGFKLKGRTTAGEIEISPGEFADVDATVDDINKAIMPLPFKEPSNALFQLLGFLVEAGQRFAGTTELNVGDANNNAPVGTTLALIESGSRVFSAIHKRLHNSQKLEFQLLAQLNGEYLDDEYPYLMENDEQTVRRADFDGRVDVLPVSDPSIYSNTQRVAQAQAIIELSSMAPELHDKYQVFKRAYEAMKIPNYDQFLLAPEDAPRTDAATENYRMMKGLPVQAFKDQDHVAHMTVLDQWFNTLPQEAQQMKMQEYISHRAEHMALYYKVQVEAMLGVAVPEEEMPPEVEKMVTNRTATLIAQNPPSSGPALPSMGEESAEPSADDLAQVELAKAQAQIKATELKAASDLKIKAAEAQMEFQIKQMEANQELQIKAFEAQLKAGADIAKINAEIQKMRAKTAAEVQTIRQKAQAELQANLQNKALEKQMELFDNAQSSEDTDQGGE